MNAEYPVERLLREAMILPIWEGTRPIGFPQILNSHAYPDY